jgi:hypothetical protein
VAVAVVSRVPQLTSPHLLLDGDEAILGLMARHLAEGREVPAFFYGQTYGFSAIEAAAGALAFRVAGAGDVQLKLAMLALWCTGVVGLFVALSHFIGPRRGFWATLVFVLMPAWSVWSMKARGGYLTAFAAAAWLWCVLIAVRERSRPAAWSLAGGLTALIFLAQRLWLPAVLPVVAWLLWKERRIRSCLAYLAGGAAVILAALALSDMSVGQMVAPPMRTQAPIAAVPEFLDRIYTNLTGSYYLWVTIQPGRITAALAWFWSGVLAGLLCLQAYRLITRRFLGISHVLCVATLATLTATWLFVPAPEPRFLLPLAALLVAWASVEAVDLADRLRVAEWIRVAFVGSVIALGALAHLEAADYSYLWTLPDDGVREKERLARVLEYVEARGIRHVFSTNGLLQWQIMFYSDEKLVARFRSDRDRYPEYVAEVDRALAAGEPVAVVGYATPMRDLVRAAAPDEAISIDDRYFVYLGADKAKLTDLGFRFFADRER